MNMRNSSLSIKDASDQFLSGLSLEKRSNIEHELNQFVQWCGKKQAMDRLIPEDAAKYCEWLAASATTEVHKKIAPVRQFLNYATENGWTKNNLAAHIRIRKGSTKTSKVIEKSAEQTEQAALLTEEGLQEIKEQLASLKQEHVSVLEDVKRARADKDFKENSPLDAAREAQAQIESRILQLEATLRSATVLDKEKSNGFKAHIGSNLVLFDLNSGVKLNYTLVDSREANIRNGKLSIASPVGKALLNCSEGVEVEVIAPVGKLRYRIEKIEG